MSNLKLASAAEAAVKSGRFELDKGYCLRFCREVDAEVDGAKYERLFRGNGTARDATAARAGHRFLAAGLGFLAKDVAKHGGILPGDMLVKTDVARNRWGDFSGHIGIVTPDGKRVAENSSTPKGRVRGALGFRTLVQYGAFDIVVRLPSKVVAKPTPAPAPTPAPVVPAPAPALLFSYNHQPMPYAFFDKGRVMVPLADFLRANGYMVQAENVTAKGGNVQAWKEPKQ